MNEEDIKRLKDERDKEYRKKADKIVQALKNEEKVCCREGSRQ